MNMKAKFIIPLLLFSCSKESDKCECRERHYEQQAVNNNGTITVQSVNTYNSQYTSQSCSNNGKNVQVSNSENYVIECK